MESYPLPSTRFFQVSADVKLAYSVIPASTRVAAPRAPIVLIVGWTGTKEDWYSLPTVLASCGHDVLVYDHRGFGESSEHVKADGKYTLELLADDAAALSRHVFTKQKIHLMGISSQTRE